MLFHSCATACRPLASSAGESTRRQPASVPSGRGLLVPVRAVSHTATAPSSVAAEAYEQPHESIRPLSRYRALLLDASYRPVGVANWQRAICLDLMEKAEVLEYYEDASVRTVQLEYFLPAVLRVRRSRPYKRHDRVALNRHNVLLRDGFACQYCGSGRDLTLDHVVPQSRGGPNSWENLVACCSPCNSKKGDKSLSQLRWKLRQHPKEPSPHEMEFLLSTVLGGSAAGLESLPTQWTNYIVPFTSKSSRKAKQAAREAEQEAMEMAG